jgi:hypothetical protein
LRIRLRHSLLASAKANRLNQNATDSGIPTSILAKSSPL